LTAPLAKTAKPPAVRSQRLYLVPHTYRFLDGMRRAVETGQ
jgi:hypothetical protein